MDNMCEAEVMADEFARKAKTALAEAQKAANRADDLRLTAIDMRGIAEVACERVLRFRAMCASCTARGEDRLRLIRVTLRVCRMTNRLIDLANLEEHRADKATRLADGLKVISDAAEHLSARAEHQARVYLNQCIGAITPREESEQEQLVFAQHDEALRSERRAAEYQAEMDEDQDEEWEEWANEAYDRGLPCDLSGARTA